MKVTFYFNSCGIMQSIVLADVLIIGTKAFYAYKAEKIFPEDTITAEGLPCGVSPMFSRKAIEFLPF